MFLKTFLTRRIFVKFIKNFFHSFKKAENRKVVGSLLCILLAFLFWLSSKLSVKHTEKIAVKVQYQNIPQGYLLDSLYLAGLSFEAEGIGYNLLKYNFSEKEIQVDISKLSRISPNKYILTKQMLNNINKEYFADLILKNAEPDTLELHLQKLTEKKIPVKVNLPIALNPEYQLEKLIIFPDSVKVHGLESYLDTLCGVHIQAKAKKEVKNSFSESFTLNDTPHIHYQTHQVQVSAHIIRVTEQEIRKKIQVLHFPENKQIKLFPSEVGLIISGNVDAIKELKESDIIVTADYHKAKDGRLPLEIYKQPKELKIRFLNTENFAEFLIQNK